MKGETHAHFRDAPPPVSRLTRKARGHLALRMAVSVPVRETFSYAVPPRLRDKVCVGCRALVPFKNRKVTGYILEEIPRDAEQDLKEIEEILDEEPLFHGNLVPFLEWIAEFYAHPVGQVIQSALPSGLNMARYKTAFLTEKGLQTLNGGVMVQEEMDLLAWIKRHPGKRLPFSPDKICRLEKKGLLKIENQVEKKRYGPLLRKALRPMDFAALETVLEEQRDITKAENEIEFLEMISRSGTTTMSDLSARFSNAAYLAKKWVKKGVLESCMIPAFRDPAGKIMFPSPLPSILFDQQKRALDQIRRALDKGTFSSCLLFGVTGSGKTEVYFRAVEHSIQLGRQAVLMLPEIALAVYMEGLFRSRLGQRIAVYHSALSERERARQWMRMVRGEVDLVIGARSALFAPLPKPGLIIVDEEHDTAYKQESLPRHQARDAAVVRAKMQKALVILGSGTPSVQSFHNAVSGKYHLISMPERIERRPLPEVEIVDLKGLDDSQPLYGMISPALRRALAENLAAGNQTILFLNRRGFHRLYLCRFCGGSVKCPNCDVPLIYHLQKEQLFCHYCGYGGRIPRKCPSCGHARLKAYGFGTQKLESTLAELFPHARVARMDTDSTRRKGEAFRILQGFSHHEIDILVGTQMITKGYDFPLVTLVGVVAADLSLGFPDFRGGERTFQILSQVAGRAGRGSQMGKVMIQTFNPEHYAINAAMTHDYPSFFEKEKDLRMQLGYPPFSHLACLKFSGNSLKRTEKSVQHLSMKIRAILARWTKRGKQIHVLGPVEAPISKMKGKYRWQLLLKSKKAFLLRHLLVEIDRISRKDLQASGVHLIIDVDPYQML